VDNDDEVEHSHTHANFHLEEVIPETPELVSGKWIDLLMLAITGGRERTEKEYRELLSLPDSSSMS
jgi:hypothetical protein